MKCTGFGAGLPDYSLFWISRYSSGHLYMPCIVVLKLSRIILKPAEAGVQITLPLHVNHHKLVCWWVTFEFMCWTCLNFSGPNFFVGSPIDFTGFQNRCSGLPNSGTSSIIIIYSYICIYIYMYVFHSQWNTLAQMIYVSLCGFTTMVVFFLKPCKSHQVHPQFFFVWEGVKYISSPPKKPAGWSSPLSTGRRSALVSKV